MNWNQLNTIDQLDEIDKASEQAPVLILKHSTTCSISAMALSRLERKWQAADNAVLMPYYLDLLRHRDISNEIEKRYNVRHQSPQVLIIRNGRCIYNTSHSEISYDELMGEAQRSGAA